MLVVFAEVFMEHLALFSIALRTIEPPHTSIINYETFPSMYETSPSIYETFPSIIYETFPSIYGIYTNIYYSISTTTSIWCLSVYVGCLICQMSILYHHIHFIEGSFVYVANDVIINVCNKTELDQLSTIFKKNLFPCSMHIPNKKMVFVLFNVFK